MALREPTMEPPQTPWGSIGALAALIIGVGVGYWACSHAPPITTQEPSPSASATAPPPTADADAPRAPPRCADVSPEPYVVGEAPPPKPAPQTPPPSDSPIPAPEEPDDLLAPFAVEVGRGAAFDGGFAVGTLRDAEGGTLAMIATLGYDGKNGKLVKLARSRGDLEPPVVTGLGSSVLTAVLEPHAGGRSIKIAKVTGDAVTFGAELSEGRDESLAMDIATSGDRAIVVWDDVLKDAKRSSIILASFDTASLRSVTQPRTASPASTDADTPRVIARPGGYWLAYAARTDAPDPDEAPKPKTKGKSKDDEDTAAAGETISNRWVELVPLDESGAAAAAPRAVTPKDGHVLAFDLELGEGGSALVAFRDDDTPSGSSGGRVSVVLIRPGGGDEPHLLADEGIGTGVPELLPGWVSIAGLSGLTRLGMLTSAGELVGGLDPEPSLGIGGEPIAAAKDSLFVARPLGKAMRLSIMKCSAPPPPPPPPPPKADAGDDSDQPPGPPQ